MEPDELHSESPVVEVGLRVFALASRLAIGVTRGADRSEADHERLGWGRHHALALHNATAIFSNNVLR
jgi:hypothetical protein